MMKKIFLCIIGFLVLREVQLEEVTIQCEVLFGTTCYFYGVSFDMETKLNIVRIGECSDEDVRAVQFHHSNVSLLHPDIATKFPNIQTIRITTNDNQLSNQEKIENCENITSLTLQMRNFTRISSSTFTSCTELITLEIETNSITDLPDGVFENQQNLERLVLKENGLNLRVKPFEPLVNLKRLEFSDMNLGEIEKNFFQVLKKLEYLWLSAQSGSYEYVFPIESLEAHPSLIRLEISHVNMRQLPDKFVPTLRTLVNLKSLELAKNLIKSVEEFTDLPQITHFDFKINRIEELPANAFKGCSGLKSLSLSYNPISILRGDEFSQLTGLENLRFFLIFLKSIAPNTFHPLIKLQELNLGGNRIQVIEKEFFENNLELVKLDLHSNKIKAIHPEALDNLSKLNEINLGYNTCVNKWFSVGERKTLDLELIKGNLTTCFQNYVKKNGDNS